MYQNRVMNFLCRKKIKILKLDWYVTGRANIFDLCEVKEKRSLCLPFMADIETTSKTYILLKPIDYPASSYLVKVNNKNTRAQL